MGCGDEYRKTVDFLIFYFCSAFPDDCETGKF